MSARLIKVLRALILAVSGTIMYAPEPEMTVAQAPTLTLILQDTATLAGSVDLSSHDGLPLAGQQTGEQGGVLSVQATTVTITGPIAVNGGDGVPRPFGLSQRLGASGGDGGMVSLRASAALQISGSVTAHGGRSINTGLGGCFNGGDGGTLQLTSASPPLVPETTFSGAGGSANQQFFCAAETGAEGSIVITPYLQEDTADGDHIWDPYAGGVGRHRGTIRPYTRARKRTRAMEAFCDLGIRKLVRAALQLPDAFVRALRYPGGD
jgi:hypothetical protein